MKNVITVVFAATAIMSGTALADKGADLAKAKQCFVCHSAQGLSANDVPSFRSIAEKYKDRKAFDAMLISQLIGSPPQKNYHWGTRVMPTPSARPDVSVEEANQLLDWVLSQKKK